MYFKVFHLIPSKTPSTHFSSMRLGQQRDRRSGFVTEIVTTGFSIYLVALRFGEGYTEGNRSLWLPELCCK